MPCRNNNNNNYNHDDDDDDVFPPCVAQSEQQRELTQIQYLAWPDHGVPDDSTDFLDFVALVRTKRAGQDQPMVVHCR